MFTYWQYLHVKIRSMLAEDNFRRIHHFVTRDIFVEVKSKNDSFYLRLYVSMIFATISLEFFRVNLTKSDFHASFMQALFREN